MPSKYQPEELVGRWGFTSYQKEADKARTVNVARGLCRSPYVIAKGPSGGLMMYLADQKQLYRRYCQDNDLYWATYNDVFRNHKTRCSGSADSVWRANPQR